MSCIDTIQVLIIGGIRIMSNKPEHKKIGFWDCMSLSIGQIIGSGVMVLTGIVIGLTGHGAPYGYIVGALLTLCLSVPFILLSSTIPASGVGYNSVKRLVGDRAAFLFIGMFILSQVLIATFAKGFASYFVAVVPSANETVVAMAALILCTVVNIIGLQTSAKVQNGMIVLLLVSLALFIAFGLPKVNWYELRPEIGNIMPNGAQSFFTGAVLLSFACGGAHFIAENGDDIEDAPHTIPKVIILSTSIVAVFYALVGCIAAGVLPVETVAFENLTHVAQEIFPTWLYYFFVIGGAWFALLSTLNGTLSWVTRGLQAAARDGWLPEKAAEENKHGVPVILLGVFFIMGAIPILTGMDLTTISNMGIGTDMLSTFLILMACWNLPKRVPDLWEKSQFHMSETALHVVLVIMVILTLASSYVNFADLDTVSLIACGIYIVALIVYTMVRYKYVASKSASRE